MGQRLRVQALVDSSHQGQNYHSILHLGGVLPAELKDCVRLSTRLEEELELCFIAELLSFDCFSFIPAFLLLFRSLITETVKGQPLPLGLYRKILAKMAYVTKPFLGNSGDPVVRIHSFTVEGQSSISDQRIKIPQTVGHPLPLKLEDIFKHN